MEWIRKLGEHSLNGIEGLGRIWLLLWATLKWLVRRWPRREVLIEQFYRIGNRSVPVVLTTGAFTGMVLAVQTYDQFKRLSVQTLVGAVVGLSMVKELGPVLTGVMLAGRVGASFTAEIGTMKVTEQIDALRCLATDPVQYLILPRLIGCVVLAPLLTGMADIIGMIGGYVIGVELFHIDQFYYIEHTLRNVTGWDVASGLIKSAFFGLLIAIIPCYKGFTCSEGAEGVGKATTEAVVITCIAILISDFFLTLLLG